MNIAKIQIEIEKRGKINYSGRISSKRKKRNWKEI